MEKIKGVQGTPLPYVEEEGAPESTAPPPLGQRCRHRAGAAGVTAYVKTPRFPPRVLPALKGILFQVANVSPLVISILCLHKAIKESLYVEGIFDLLLWQWHQTASFHCVNGIHFSQAKPHAY